VTDSILEGLLDSDIVTVEVDLGSDALDDLTPEEAAALPHAHEHRLLEFRGGRHCARAALARLGVRDVAILRNEDRSPVWPSGFVGSITHTRARERGWCAAAVARSTDARAVGIDGELDQPLERKLWSRILLPSEESYLLSQPDDLRGFLGKLVFSAKEATYKCQYSLTREFLDFADVHVELAPEDASFVAELTRAAGSFVKGFSFQGRYARRNGIIATAVALR
jgi:4'-phosphopantetheinyl transferase EntD